MALIDEYVALLTSEHQKPKLQAMIAALVEGSVTNQTVLGSLIDAYDIELATGARLDAIGEWVGIARLVRLGSTGAGTLLADDDYRLLLLARIAANHWDGTVPGAYTVLAQAFSGYGIMFGIQDNQDMSYDVLVYAATLTAVQIALITGNYLLFKPGGVRVGGYWQSSVQGDPIFGLDIENNLIAGLDVGAWAVPLTGA